MGISKAGDRHAFHPVIYHVKVAVVYRPNAIPLFIVVTAYRHWQKDDGHGRNQVLSCDEIRPANETVIDAL